MEKVTIEAEVREGTGRDALRRLRQAGKVPAVLYGGQGESIPLQVNPRTLVPVVGAQARHHTLFQLRVPGKEETLAMVAETQWEPVRGTLVHVDFKRVLMDKKIRVPVPVVPVGEAAGIKEQGGLFEVVLREVEVECLPEDLPEQITVEVTPLLIGQHVRVSDLQKLVGERVRLVREPQAVVCHVVAPKAVEEVKPAEVAAEAPAEPEVIKKGKAVEEGEGETEAKEPAETRGKKEAAEPRGKKEKS